MQSRRPSGLALAVPQPLLHRRSSLLSLDTAASPHTPRSCASALPPPDLYLQPTISKRTSTTSWNSSNADEMDFDWKPDQVLLLSRTLDALPAHLVTPFHGPIPPSNLLDKIARGVSQAKGPLDWPHSIRATRVKLLELARARAKDDKKKKEQPQLLPPKVVVDAHHDHGYFDDQNPIHPDDGPQRRPLYKQSSMDFITPDPAEIKDNSTIAQLSNRLQRTDRSFPTPATTTSYHPYKTPSRIAVARSRTSTTAGTKIKSPKTDRDSSPPRASDVPDLIVPNPNSLSNSSSNSSFSSSVPPSAAGVGLRPPLLRRSASTLSSSSMYSSSSAGSGRALQDKRLQRVREVGAEMSFGPPAPPPKDYPARQSGIVTPPKGTKRAPSYGALAQGVRQEGAFFRAMKDVVAQEAGSGSGSADDSRPRKNKDKENALQQQMQQTPPQQKHARQPSYPSSDEEEKARASRAKKMRSASGAGHSKLMSPSSALVPPSPSVVSLSSTSSESASGESMSAPVIATAPSTPQAVGAPTPPAKDRFLASPRALRTPSRIPSASKGTTRVLLLKPEPTVLIASPESAGNGKEGKEERARMKKPYLYGGAVETGVASNGHNGANNTSGPASPVAASASANGHNKRPSAPKMNAQRNPSMFGMELPRLSALSSSSASAAAPASQSGSTSAPTRHKHGHQRTLSRESAVSSSTGTMSTTGSMIGSVNGSLMPPLCGDAALSVPPSPLTLGFAQDVRRHGHAKRPSAERSSVPVPAPAPAPACSVPISASAVTSITASPVLAPASPASPRGAAAKTLRRVRHRLAPPLALARRISFGSLLESVDDREHDAMDVDVDRDDRSFDLSGGRMGLGGGFSGGLGLSFGADDAEREGAKKQKKDVGGGGGRAGSGSVFGAVLGEAFSVQPRAVPERAARRDRDRGGYGPRSRDSNGDKDKERATPARGSSLKEGALGSAFRMA